MSVHYCPVAGGRLAIQDIGAGPAIILLHGFSFDMRAWDRQVGRLARHNRVIRYDMRGFGRSSLPTGPYSHEADLAALLQMLGVEQPILLGLSLGANVALGFALEYPDRTGALILASPGLPGFQWSATRPPEAAMVHASGHGVDSARAFWLDHAMFDPLRRDPAAFRDVAAMVADYGGWHWTNANPVQTKPVMDRLSMVEVPTLILSGDLDVQGYRDIATLLSRQIPRATLRRFSNAGHILNDEADDGFVAAVRAFADDHSRSV